MTTYMVCNVTDYNLPENFDTYEEAVDCVRNKPQDIRHLFSIKKIMPMVEYLKELEETQDEKNHGNY